MHIPDGYLATEVALGLDVGAAVALGGAFLMLRRRPDARAAAAPAVGAAVFAAQMLNVHVAGGTSGHLVGAVLACMLLGAPLGFLTIAVVLGVQAVAFADGGLLALGANVLVMGGLGAAAAALADRLSAPRPLAAGSHASRTAAAADTARGALPRPLAAGLAAAAALMAGACAVGALLELSGTAPDAIGVMAETHVPIALIEGAVTALVVTAAALPLRGWALRGACGALIAGLVALTPLAAASPDGLERVALDLGFSAQATAGAAFALAPDYAAPGLDGATATTIGAALLGIVLVAGVLALLVGSRRPAAVLA